ncbi:MAG: hypothetical protein Q4P36_05735 [Bowdeniella nasicola]|nr:hypothetical protein [Bowdeniella nasicola]
MMNLPTLAETARLILLIGHLLSMAFVFGAALAGLSLKRVPKGLVHGALGALGFGILLVLLMEFAPTMAVNHMKVGIKLLIALAVAFFAWRAEDHREQPGARRDLTVVAALTGVNVAVAILF